MAKLKDYEGIIGPQAIEELLQLAGKLQGITVQNINSTAVGGGVAEILHRMIPFFQELGIAARWDVIKGGEKFFGVTKRFHNALHSKSEAIGPEDFTTFLETT